MTAYEYLAVVTSIVIGLAITQLLSGIGRVYHARKNVRTYWLHSAWLAVLLFLAFRLWWAFWVYRDVTGWAFSSFLLYLSPSVVFYFLTSIATPDFDTTEATDLKAYYYSNRVGFFGALAAHGILGLIAPVVILQLPLLSFLTALRVFGIGIMLAAMWSSRERTHAAVLIGFAAMLAAIMLRVKFRIG